MMRRKVVKGTVILAAAVSAALSACDDDGSTAGGAAAGGDDAGTGGGDEAGGTGGTGGGSGGNPGGGGTDLGGMGGMGGDDSVPPLPPTAEELVEEFCADGPTYTLVEGTEAGDNYYEYSSTDSRALVTHAGNDLVYYQGSSQGTPLPVCVVSGAGDDDVWLQGSADGYSGEYSGSAVELTFAGGEGDDTLNYSVYVATNIWASYRPPFHFVDFESGGDQIVIDAGATSVAGAAGIAWVSAFGPTTAHPNAHTDSASFAVVVDTTDNEVWFSYYNEGAQQNILIGSVEGDTLTTGDVVFPPPT